MKALLEKIEPSFGSSFAFRKFHNQFLFKDPVWHFHPEYEIVYVSNGQGKRHIGNHISYYKNGDLIFLGPNLPHFGFTIDTPAGHTEAVVQMRPDFLGEQFILKPEMQDIKRLLERSHSGLSFYGQTCHRVGRHLLELCEASPFEKLHGLLHVLNQLALSDEYEDLHANGFTVEVMVEDEERIQRVYKHVQTHYREEITLETVAREANLSIPAFCRFFKKLTNQTFTNFVNEFRVANACKLLQESDRLISDICLECGFQNLAHFNKQFRRITGKTPTGFKREARPVIHLPMDIPG